MSPSAITVSSRKGETRDVREEVEKTFPGKKVQVTTGLPLLRHFVYLKRVPEEFDNNEETQYCR